MAAAPSRRQSASSGEPAGGAPGRGVTCASASSMSEPLVVSVAHEATAADSLSRSVMSLDGELDVATVRALEEAVLQHLRPAGVKGREVVLDISGLSFVDVAGARALERAWTAIRAADGRPSITGARPQARWLLVEVGAGHAMSPSPTESRASMRRQRPAATTITVPLDPSGPALGLLVRQVRYALAQGDVRIDTAPALGWSSGPRLVLHRLRHLAAAAGRSWDDPAAPTPKA